MVMIVSKHENYISLNYLCLLQKVSTVYCSDWKVWAAARSGIRKLKPKGQGAACLLIAALMSSDCQKTGG